MPAGRVYGSYLVLMTVTLYTSILFVLLVVGFLGICSCIVRFSCFMTVLCICFYVFGFVCGCVEYVVDCVRININK